MRQKPADSSSPDRTSSLSTTDPPVPFNRPRKPGPGDDPKERHQKIDRLHVLKRCTLFKTLSGWELSSISRLTRIVEFKKGEVVYRQGDLSGSFYLVISGRFEAFIPQPHGGNQVLAYLKQGSYFGEMSLLSPDEKHTATVLALSDSLVLEISKDDFRKIVESNAAVSLEISRVLNARLKAQNVRAENPLHLLKSDIIAVCSTHRRTGKTSFSINLAASLGHETGQKTVLVDMSPTGNVIRSRLKIGSKTDLAAFQDLERGAEGALASHLVRHESGIEVLDLGTSTGTTERPSDLATHLLNRLSVDFRFIVVDLPNDIDDTVLAIMTQADHLFFVTDNNMSNVSEAQRVLSELDATIGPLGDKAKVVINESFLGFSPTSAVKAELFGKRDCFFLPSIRGGEEEREGELAVIDRPGLDYSKGVRLIARKISRNLIGLALGSGAALGFAHIGVLKVLEREGIPVDCIAGSSMGALIAAFYAIGKTPQECEDIAVHVTAMNLMSKLDVAVFPIRGFIKGRRLEKYFAGLLKDLTFEETKIPLIVSGMNINTRKEVVMTSGLLSQAVRASIAIPGIFHPVTIDGDTIVDGGIIDPLPIRPLIDMGANKIIAVDVLPTPADIMEKRRHRDEVQRRLDAKMKNRHVVLRGIYRFQKAFGRFFMPNIVDIIVNSMQTMEHEIAETLAAEADVLIRPSMPLSSWTEFHKAKEIIRLGEASAEASLDEIKALVKQQTA